MEFCSPWWLVNRHVQTILPAKWIRKPRVQYHRLRWSTPDGDFLDLDFTAPAALHGSFDTLWILFHGLEGSSASHYSLALMQRAKAVGALGVVVHFRGCSGENNWQPRAYHSGDSAEMDWVLRQMHRVFPDARRLVLGVSLGGNVLLKWLGEQGEGALSCVHAAVAISAPVDLLAGAQALAQGFNRVYTRMFLSSLVPKAIQKTRRYPQLGSVQRLRACRTLFDFDGCVTAPWHGFDSARDYYAKSSSKQHLRGVAVPTLMVNALNDPFLPAHCLPLADEVSPQVQRLFTRQGGHVGFAKGPGLKLNLDWLPDVCQSFFEGHCN